MTRRVRRHKPILVALLLLVGAFGLCLPQAAATASGMYRDSNRYKATSGRWHTLELPDADKVNAVHAAMLPTGKVLLIAGSGNDADQFAKGTFKTLIWDPTKGTGRDAFTLVFTPTDVFCGGHAFLPDGTLLVAGGTQSYEKLAGTITNAGGAMTVKNEAAGGRAFTLAKGTLFEGANGKLYRSRTDVTVQPATRAADGRPIASQTDVFVDAVQSGAASVVSHTAQYTIKIKGMAPSQARLVYGLADKIDMSKQEYQGTAASYIFDPYQERYERVGDLNYKRWYPTLFPLTSGNVLAVSGLDGTGTILDGQNEEYDPKLQKWFDRPALKRYFPTYPWLALTADGDHAFYSGSNAGYGSATVGRTPGLWDLTDNSFTTVPGLRDADETETSTTVLLPLRAASATQKASYTAMILGGGGVGSSERSTARTDLVDLTAAHPRYTPGPDLPHPTRYANAVVLPDDTVLVTGGSSGYRGDGASDNHDARIYHPDTNTFTTADSPAVGRDYHSGALLLPSGEVLTFGGNSLFSDQKDTTPAKFEQRLEIYTPAYLYKDGGKRPTVTGGPAEVTRGTTRVFTSPDAAAITSARLIDAGTATHATNVEQRSVALDVTHVAGGVALSVPAQAGLLPSGDYMLFVTNAAGVPSVARWVRVH